MVEQADAHRLPGLRHAAREGEIFRAGTGITTRMRVKEQHPRGALQQALAQDGSRLYGGPVQGAAKELGLGDESLPGIDEEGAHDLLVDASVAQAEVARHRGRLAQQVPDRHLGPGHPATELHGCQQGRRLRGSNAAPTQTAGVGASQPVQPSQGLEQAAPELESRGAATPGAQNDGHQLAIRDARRTTLEKALSRPLFGRHVAQDTDHVPGRRRPPSRPGAGFDRLRWPLVEGASRRLLLSDIGIGTGGPRFGDVPEAFGLYETSRVAILPIPFERTTSWGTGTYLGPHAILQASRYLELWDEETRREPYRLGISTLRPCRPSAALMRPALDQIREAASRPLADGKFLLALGGEHSLSLPLVEAALERHPDLGVLQLDAHADLRQEYQKTPYSHACVMRRILDLGVPTAAVGLRSLSKDEADLIRERRLQVVWAIDMQDDGTDLQEVLAALPETIYLTFDVDFLDPSLLPATGTPEPGGGRWYPTLRLLRQVFATKKVVAMDLVELAPRTDAPASDFLVAKLAYKCIGYLDAAG